jgi:hypothetical protein
LYGTVVSKSQPYTLPYQNGWYRHRFGSARVWGDYKATVYVDGVAVGSATTHVGL